MNILLEGPYWMGQWTEIVDEALRSLGHKTCLHYHNVKPLEFRLRKFIPGNSETLVEYSNSELLKKGSQGGMDLLFSIQGKLDAATVHRLREINPKLRIIYWFGDILLERARQRVEEVYPLVDCLLLSYYDNYLEMRRTLGPKVGYFPFGVSQHYHCTVKSSRRDFNRYSTDVAFVGTHYNERDLLLGSLLIDSSAGVKVWGRGWRRSKLIRSKGRLSMTETLKVYQNAKISLNIHHQETQNGFNMKFFEIPAAGGFQICDWQPELERLNLDGLVATYRDRDDLIDKIDYYLSREELRKEMSHKFKAYLFENFRYDLRLNHLIENLEVD